MPKAPDLPFSAHMTFPRSTEESRVSMDFLAVAPHSHLEFVQDILQNYMAAADAGSFSGAAAPSDARWTVASTETEELGRLRYECVIRGCEEGAFRVLLNSIVQSHWRDEPIASFAFRTVAASGETFGLETALEQPFPGRFNDSRFHLDLENLGARKSAPLIRMEFERELTDEEFDTISKLITNWETLVIVGGYVNSLARMEELQMAPSELYLASPTTVEDSIPEFQAPREAFNGIINLSSTLHNTVCPLRRMSIE
jgi:hypothetical protein